MIASSSLSLCVQNEHLIQVALGVGGFLLCCALTILYCCYRCSKGGKLERSLSDERRTMSFTTGASTITPQKSINALTRQPTPAGALTRQATLPRCRSVERAVDEGRQRTDDALPDGWQEHTDLDGSTYFFNLSTRDMSWTRPVGSPAAAQPNPASPGEPCYRAGATVAIDHRQPLHHEAGAGPARSTTLPAGWQAQHDVQSGCSYFLHGESHRSAWVPPPAE